MKLKLSASLLAIMLLPSSSLLASGFLAEGPKVAQDVLMQTHQMTDKNIVAVMLAVDNNEMAAARLVEHKQVRPLVKHYARSLYRQHAENQKRLMALAKNNGLEPVQSNTSETITADGAQELKTLTALNGKELEAAYIDAMIKGHEDGLKLIDNDLSKNVVNVKLKSFVKSFRMMVAHHLAKGKHIKQQLKLS